MDEQPSSLPEAEDLARMALRRRIAHRGSLPVRLERGGYLQLGLLTIAYFIAGILGLHVGLIEQGAVTTLWVPSGIAIAAVITVGWLAIPMVLVGDLFVSLGSGLPPALSFMLALVTTAEVVLGGWLLRSFWRVDPTLTRIRSVLLLVMAALVAPIVSATPGVLLLVTHGLVQDSGAAAAWLAWWLADAMAILLIAPLILVWSRPRQSIHLRALISPRRKMLEAAGILGGILLTTLLAFRSEPHGVPAEAFLIFPFLLVAALRFGTHGATAGSFLAAAVALWTRVRVPAPVPTMTPGEDILMLQLFFGLPAATALLLAAALSERRRALEVVESQRDQLEAAVHARTSELAALNQQLRSRVDELAAANEELEAFSYSASHDLRAPLRRMDMLLDMLAHDEAESLGPGSAELVGRLQGENRRLKQLVDDLLELSRMARVEPRREQIDLSAMAAEIMAQLQNETPGREVDVIIQPDIVAEADPGLMRIALENLLGNAWKYTSPVPRARIEMTGKRDSEGALTLCVSDNGVGFPSEEAALLFRPFRRLHADPTLEGTGVGLATVRRIMDRHGGSVHAEGEPGRGARFCVTLPPA